MKALSRVLLALAVCALMIHGARSGDDQEVRAIIAKGMKARGITEASEAKFKAITLKGAGTFHGLGEGIAFTGEWKFQGHTQSHFTLDIQNLTFSEVINGDKGWVKFNNEVKPMPKEELAEEQEALYAKWVATLVPLKNKAFTLAGIGEVKVGDAAALGVRVTHEGQRDITLFFFKTSGLLLKSEHMIKDVKGGGNKEMQEETLFSDYKEFAGIKSPTKVTIKRDDKLFVEAEFTDIRPLESLDPSVFAEP